MWTFYVLSRALLDVFGNVSAVLMLKKCMSEEEGRAEGGTAGARMEGLPVQAFQMEELLLMVCLQKWRECVQESRKQQKKTDVSHFYLFMSKTRKHFLNLISCNLHRLAVLMTLFLLKCFNLETNCLYSLHFSHSLQFYFVLRFCSKK